VSTPTATPERRRRVEPVQWAVLVLVLAATGLLLVLTTGGANGGTDDGAAGADADGAVEAPAAGADTSEPDGPAPDAVEPDAPRTLEMARRDPTDPLTDGPVDAPVTLVVYSDYQCPFCALWSHQTLPTMREYAAAGSLRIEWRDVNVFGVDSARAARAAYAAGLQGAFWEYHDALFAEGEKPAAAVLTDDGLAALAAQVGLDTERFAADVASAEVGAAVQANADEGMSIGATSTPSFLVGGVPVVGAQPTEVFVAAVEDALVRVEG
jgi:protein-disulfide isomerase